tara:strand:+ start:3122 stop:3307 length:186 start_codon:yes stop_codon:yes gene_type:complete
VSLYKNVKDFLSDLKVGDIGTFDIGDWNIKTVRMTINKTKGDAFIVTRDIGKGELLVMRVG